MKDKLSDDRPIFLQIKESIEEDILSGNLKPDDQIPSTNELVTFYNVNPVTVLKGVNLLTDEGLIYKKRGIGMFVAQDAKDILKKRYQDTFTEEYVDTMIRKAQQLDMEKETLIKIIEKNWKRGE